MTSPYSATYVCPNCRSAERFSIDNARMVTTGQAYITGEGDVLDYTENDGATDWGNTNRMECETCQHIGTVQNFLDKAEQLQSEC